MLRKTLSLAHVLCTNYRCPPCKGFTPLLTEFYNLHSKDIEIVYVSSDHSIEEFNEYYGKMPWVAQPVDAASALLKNELAKKLHIKGIPALVVFDKKTGNFVTDLARNQVTQAVQNKTTAKLIEEWKTTPAVPIEEAQITGGKSLTGIMDIIYMVLKNPVAIFAIMYVFKKAMKLFIAYGKKGGEDSVTGGGGSVGGGDEF